MEDTRDVVDDLGVDLFEGRRPCRKEDAVEDLKALRL